MLEVDVQKVSDAVSAVGIQRGDGLLVHSAIQYLGRPQGGVGIYLNAVRRVIGTDGTLVVPTFNFSFARGERYDPEHAPSKGMGVFSEHVRQQPGARRTQHPMQSLAVIGRHADDLAGRDTPGAFDPGSAFERMLELDFKILLLGADVNAISLLHYSEQRREVPYRYWKDFTGEVRTSRGWQTRTYRMFVRDMDIDPQLTLNPVKDYLEANGLWKSVALNYGYICSCRISDFISAVDSFLSRDPWILGKNKPQGNSRK